jgi:hypothetical protein
MAFSKFGGPSRGFVWRVISPSKPWAYLCELCPALAAKLGGFRMLEPAFGTFHFGPISHRVPF